MAIKRISSSKCSRVRSTRGSRKSAKYFRGLSISPSQLATTAPHIAIKMRLPWYGGGLVTDKQVRRLFALIKTEESQEIAASKAGMDAKTARKYRRLERLLSELPSAVRGRTRPDPFIDVWDNVQKLFEDNAGLEAKTVFEFLQRQNPGRFEDGQVRTLQRRVKVWRATEGPAREVFFAQKHPPGRLG